MPAETSHEGRDDGVSGPDARQTQSVAQRQAKQDGGGHEPVKRIKFFQNPFLLAQNEPLWVFG